MLRFTFFLVSLSLIIAHAVAQSTDSTTIKPLDLWATLQTADKEAILAAVEKNGYKVTNLVRHLNQSLTDGDSLCLRLIQAAEQVYFTSPASAKLLAMASQEVAELRGDTLQILYAKSMIGTASGELGEYQKALVYFFDILKMTEHDPNSKLHKRALNEIGRQYSYLKEHANAIKYYKQMIAIATRFQDNALLANANLNIGVSYFEIDSLTVAMDHLEDSYTYALEVKDVSLQYNCIGNLSLLYLTQGRIEDAIEIQKKGLALEQEENDVVSMIDSHAVLAECYQKKGNFKQALFHFSQSLEMAESQQIIDKLTSVYLLGSELYAEIDDYKTALSYSIKYNKLYESSLSIEKNNLVAEIRERYETDKKEAAIESLEKDNQIATLELGRERTQKTIWLILFLFMLIVVLSAFWAFFFIRKQKRQLELRNQQILDINDQLTTSQQELLEANKTKDKLFAIIAHDLRSPIASFQGIGKMLEYTIKKGKPESTDQLISSIDQSANAINTLLDNLLQWSLSQTDALRVNKVPVHLNVLIDDVIDIFHKNYQAKSIELINEIEGDTWVHADFHLVNTVFRNLLANACKFTPSGGKVRLHQRLLGAFLEVTISDNGVGIAPDRLATIFSLNGNKSTPGTEGEKGTGLGMMLCKEFIEKNGGTISIASTPNEGTSISFTLPYQEVQEN